VATPFIFRNKIIYRSLLAIAILLILVFYDITLPIINGIIQLKINILGFFLEPLLQWAFDVSLRQAQIIAAWIYLFIASIIVWFFLIKICQGLLASFYAIKQCWARVNNWKKAGLVFLFVALFAAIGKAVFLFV
jgi:hypothetical protein